MLAENRPQVGNMAKRQRILRAALTVFSEHGFSAASMDAIARAANVSKPTLYVYFGDKQLLFEQMLLAPRTQMLEALARPSESMVRDLHSFAWAYANTVLSPDLLALARLVIAEGQRFPKIGKAYQQAGPDKLLHGIMDYLCLKRNAGQLAFDDPELAAQDLWALILSAPRNKALHIPDYEPRRSEVRRYLENGLRVFLKAYSSAPGKHLRELADLTSKKAKRK